MTPLQEVINVLRNSSAVQTKHQFIDFGDCNDESSPKAYCALGVLICNKENIKNLAQFHHVHINEVWDKYGVNIMGQILYTEDGAPLMMDSKQVDSIYQMITYANDYYDLTFKEIADLLETTFEDVI